MESTVIAVDLAKDVFEVAVSPVPGTVSKRHRLSRAKWELFIAETPTATFLLEACGTAHHWGRRLESRGHRAVLISPHIVRRYVTRNKTDATDAKALLEAYRNEEIRPVPVKSEALQGLAGLHRLRTGWLRARTAQINEIRGLLREFGLPIPVGVARFLLRASNILHDSESGIPPALRSTLELALEEVAQLTSRIDRAEKQIQAIARETPVVSRLRTIPGVGVLTATAALTSIVDARRFPSGRRLASSLGLTPREHSSGGRRWLGRISKRGDPYLRTLLVHGGRSVLRAAKLKTTPSPLEAWAVGREKAIGHNKAAVAVANKLARILWAVWTRGVPYQSVSEPQASS